MFVSFFSASLIRVNALGCVAFVVNIALQKLIKERIESIFVEGATSFSLRLNLRTNKQD